MCMGLPMEVLHVEGTSAECLRGTETSKVDLSLIDPVEPGQHVLVFLGRAIEVLTAHDAQKIDDALEAVERARTGQSFDHLFADLVEREPSLPPHLQSESREKTSDPSTC